MLYSITHDIQTSLWCGPAAAATLTGKPTSEITAVMRSISGARAIKGVTHRTLLLTLQTLGMDFQRIHDDRHMAKRERATLAGWLKMNRHAFAEHPVLIAVTGHYVVVHGRRFIDNHTGGTVSLSDAPHRRARVAVAWRIKEAA